MKRFIALITISILFFQCSNNVNQPSYSSSPSKVNTITAQPNTTIAQPETTISPNDVLDYLESIAEVQKEIVALEKKVTLDNKKWDNAELTYGTAKELFSDNIKTANIIFNKFAEIKAPPYKNLKGVHTNFILLVRELSLNTQYMYEGLVAFNDLGEQREYIYNIFSQNYIIFDDGINDLIESVTVDGKTINPKKPLTTTTTLAPTTTTVPKTTTTTVPKTTTTSNAKWGQTNFDTKDEWIRHILYLQFLDGYRGYNGDAVINYRNGERFDCSTKNTARGCRSYYDVFPWIGSLSLSSANDGGKRAFGSMSVSLPSEYEVSVGVNLLACRPYDFNCALNRTEEYDVLLTDFRVNRKIEGDGLSMYDFDLVGASSPISDTNFFYPDYWYFLDYINVTIYDRNDPLNWAGYLKYQVAPGVGTYVTQFGWDEYINVGWLDTRYNFLYTSLREYENTPYFTP
ncbi:hypothetical protein OAQ05_01340 [Acidimicrobiia bacterium]|nr:hypothetical protein [Acidimicrobiia bacterium]